MRYEFTIDKEQELWQDIRCICGMSEQQQIEEFNRSTCGCYHKSYQEWSKWHAKALQDSMNEAFIEIISTPKGINSYHELFIQEYEPTFTISPGVSFREMD